MSLHLQWIVPGTSMMDVVYGNNITGIDSNSIFYNSNNTPFGPFSNVVCSKEKEAPIREHYNVLSPSGGAVNFLEEEHT